jgi:hypothetical protein
MSASQANATSIWSYLSPEQAYQLTVSTHILAGTLAVRSFLLPHSFFTAYVVSDGGSNDAKHSSVLDHVLGYIE